MNRMLYRLQSILNGQGGCRVTILPRCKQQESTFLGHHATNEQYHDSPGYAGSCRVESCSRAEPCRTTTVDGGRWTVDSRRQQTVDGITREIGLYILCRALDVVPSDKARDH